MRGDIWFTRLRSRRDYASVTPLIDELAPVDFGAGMTVSHRLMWSVMPGDVLAMHDRASTEKPDMAAFLWREAESGRKFYILGPRPVASSPFFIIESKPYEPEFIEGDCLTFDLRVNATVSQKEYEGFKGRCRPLDVVMASMRAEEASALASGFAIAPRTQRRMETAERSVTEWLKRVGAHDGFEVKSTHLDSYHDESLPRRGFKAKIGVCDLRGTLEVTDSERFLARVLRGFGRAKAFGCGMMLLRR